MEYVIVIGVVIFFNHRLTVTTQLTVCSSDFTTALHQEGLFRVNGNVRIMETLRDRLESGEDVDLHSESDPCTVASLIKQYLRDLPEGLVNSTVQRALIRQHEGKRKSECYSTNCCLAVFHFNSGVSVLKCPTSSDR